MRFSLLAAAAALAAPVLAFDGFEGEGHKQPGCGDPLPDPLKSETRDECVKFENSLSALSVTENGGDATYCTLALYHDENCEEELTELYPLNGTCYTGPRKITAYILTCTR